VSETVTKTLQAMLATPTTVDILPALKREAFSSSFS
jgi:hypothetical protein